MNDMSTHSQTRGNSLEAAISCLDAMLPLLLVPNPHGKAQM